jgi:hypothetical protein
LAVHRATLDHDGDGRVGSAEYARTRWQGPSFAGADRDGDGDLSAAELLVLFRAQSPTTFDGQAVADEERPKREALALPAAQQDVWEVLAWMGDALRQAGVGGPDPDWVAAAVWSGSFGSAETHRVLASLRPGWMLQGWRWPDGLPAPEGEVLQAPLDVDPSATILARLRLQRLGPQGSASGTSVPGAQ